MRAVRLVRKALYLPLTICSELGLPLPFLLFLSRYTVRLDGPLRRLIMEQKSTQKSVL